MAKFGGFSTVELNKPQRSQFDLSHFERSSTRMGRMTPCYVSECVPSDTFHGSTEILLRLAPLLAPIYDQIVLFVHFWFTPNRLLWEEWETFITGGRLGVGIDPAVAPVPPFIDIGEMALSNPDCWDESSLADYLGCPIFPLPGDVIADYDGIPLDAMPFLSYQLIWHENYRDRNFISDDDWFNGFPFPSGQVANLAVMDLHQRSYLHDYFTSALPFTQRGEEVLMPVTLGGIAPLYANPLDAAAVSSTVSAIEQPGSISVGYGIELDNTVGDNGQLYVKGEDFAGTSTTIEDFRSAYALQVWLERNAIGGSRYTESTQAHFGVKPQDSRLQRPEYIGGGRINVRISEVVSTSYSVNEADEVVPLANLGGHGVTYGDTNRFNYFCTEHGFIMGILTIMPLPSYHQGLPRMFRRRSFLDYPWPTFAKLGEQQVDKAELFASAANLTEDADGNLPLFGYQSRYADWKYICNSNHGVFHSSFLFWTLTRDFADSPELGYLFNEVPLDIEDRIFVTGTGEDHFWMYINNDINVRRPLPYYGKPNTLGFV